MADLTGRQRKLKRAINAAAALVLVIGGLALAVVLFPAGEQVDAFGYAITLHANGRLDVWQAGRNLVRWDDFGCVSIPVGVVIVVAYAILRGMAADVGKPPPAARAESPGSPID